MTKKPDYLKKKYGSMLDKTLKNALAHQIGKHFPRIGGPRILDLCAEMVLEVVNKHIRPLEHIQHGQILWNAISVDDPPSRGKRTKDTDMVPVILDLCTPKDIEAIVEKRSSNERLEQKAIRLCLQTFEQGALLSNCDLSGMLHVNDSHIARRLCEYEKRTGKIIPRRATLHDVGRGLTHKRIICRKRYLEGKPSHEIARETYHSIEAVDRYLGQFDRVRHCRLQGFSLEHIAYTLNCSISLVKEYLSIDLEMENKND